VVVVDGVDVEDDDVVVVAVHIPDNRTFVEAAVVVVDSAIHHMGNGRRTMKNERIPWDGQAVDNIHHHHQQEHFHQHFHRRHREDEKVEDDDEGDEQGVVEVGEDDDGMVVGMGKDWPWSDPPDDCSLVVVVAVVVAVVVPGAPKTAISDPTVPDAVATLIWIAEIPIDSPDKSP
jgi:hypothetical protein